MNWLIERLSESFFHSRGCLNSHGKSLEEIAATLKRELEGKLSHFKTGAVLLVQGTARISKVIRSVTCK